MPIKLRPSAKEWVRTDRFNRTGKSIMKHHYIKTISQKELFEDMGRRSGEDVELVISPVNNSWDSFTWDIKKK